MLYANSDEFIAVNDLANHLPGRPSRATVWRWLLRGVKGHRLESTLVGGRRFVRSSSLKAWLAAINHSSPDAAQITQSQRDRTAKAAVDVLKRKRL